MVAAVAPITSAAAAPVIAFYGISAPSAAAPPTSLRSFKSYLNRKNLMLNDYLNVYFFIDLNFQVLTFFIVSAKNISNEKTGRQRGFSVCGVPSCSSMFSSYFCCSLYSTPFSFTINCVSDGFAINHAIRSHIAATYGGACGSEIGTDLRGGSVCLCLSTGSSICLTSS